MKPVMPAGCVAPFAMASAPAGWLVADGREVGRAEYPALFAAIGEIYGPGDGVGTFRLPDLRGEFVRGVDAGRGIDAGRVLGSGQGAGNAAHTHAASAAAGGAHTHTVTASADSGGGHTHTVTASAAAGGAHTHTVTASAASGGAHTHKVAAASGSGSYLYIPHATGSNGAIAGGGAGVVENTGAHTHTVTASAASGGNHTHTVTASAASGGAHTHTVTASAASGGGHAHTVTVESQGGEARPRNVALLYCISTGAVPLPVMPQVWLEFPLPASGYICPMVAQLALLRGVEWSEAGGLLLIGGAVLMGQAGGVYEFAGIATAANWVELTRDRGAAELETLAGLNESEAMAWKTARRAVLADYAARVIDRAAGVADPAKQAAMVQESNFSALKWA